MGVCRSHDLMGFPSADDRSVVAPCRSSSIQNSKSKISHLRQRRYVPKPRVAVARRLPWDHGTNDIEPQRGSVPSVDLTSRPPRTPVRTEPRCGSIHVAGRSQGRLCEPTLGFGTQPPWDCMLRSASLKMHQEDDRIIF